MLKINRILIHEIIFFLGILVYYIHGYFIYNYFLILIIRIYHIYQYLSFFQNFINSQLVTKYKCMFNFVELN
jgi:hypothetical protein